MTRLKTATMTEADYERAADEYIRSLPMEHFMEAIPRSMQRKIAWDSLGLLQVQRPDVQVFNELLVQYPIRGGFGQVVPDNMVLLSDKPVRAKGSFNLPYESARPLWVLEYVSDNTEGKDYEECFYKYERELKVPYCLQFHPDNQDLRVYKHGGRRYRKMRKNAQGRYPIPELDLEIGLHAGWVRFWHKGTLLPLPGELQEELESTLRRAQAAEAEVARLRAELRKRTNDRSS